MFKTIFSRLIAIFIAILIIGFSITGVMLYYFLGDFMSNEKVNVLTQSIEGIDSFLKEYLKTEETQLSKLALSNLLNYFSRNTNSIILIVNTKGDIIYTGPSLYMIREDIIKHITDGSGKLRFPDARQYEKIIAGQEFKEIGNFYGLFNDTGYSWLTIAKPFKYSQSGSAEQIIGAIYVHTPLPGIETTRRKVFQFYMLSVAASIVISVILVYIFSLRISSPIKQIRNAAKVIAGGEFKKRLNINTKDEIGDLANTFNQMVTALENLEEMRRGFIANVSHELRTPITSIKGFIEGILDDTIPPDKQKYYLTIVRDETERLNRLVNDLLDLARMESGELKLNKGSFNINELIRRCIIKLENLIVQKAIEVQADFEEESMFVYADADAIERVIQNLIHNAIKFTSSDNGKISISTAAQKNKIIISIKDNGAGIGSDETDLIWERFYKSDKSRSKDKAGAGLGLAIIKNLINEHGQEIWVESKPGEGSRFSFTLERTHNPESEQHR